MPQSNSKKQLLNQLLNLFWTILCFMPVLWYWTITGADKWLYLFIVVSIITALLPANFLRLLQLSNNTRFYEQIGIKTIRRFVQNGDLINRFSTKKSTQYSTFKNKQQVKNYLKTIAMYERYHLICFVFFLLTAFHSLCNHNFKMASIITAGNIVYNICPVLLQQYNKIKIQKLIKNRTNV